MQRTLLPTLRLSLEMTETLTEIERNGLKINLDTLKQIETEFQTELDELEIRLNEMAREAMGDTPINLASPDDRSILLYSRKVKDKKEWSRMFNLGHEMRGATMKPKQRVRMKRSVFASTVRRMTDVVKKTVGSRCAGCLGHGRVRPVNKNGQPSKVLRVCKFCKGVGVIYTPTREVAGFKLVPRDTFDTAAAGFKTDKTTLEDRSIELSGQAKEFATAYIRYNALRTYLNTFVEGMKNNVDANGIIHPEFMQCVTATGRLSSRNPNFQNMPRGNTFAIRKVVESRFDGGYILEGDYSQLEFRVAAFLSQDETAIKEIKEGFDVHSYTAKVITDAGQPTSRQDSKQHTFAPLYGATGFGRTKAEATYYERFIEKFKGVASWHGRLAQQALDTSTIKIPSGREFRFNNVYRLKNNSITNFTQIKNYPVQSFATADCVLLCLVYMDKLLKDKQSCIVNTVHDSIVIDIHPSEIDEVIQVINDTNSNLKSLIDNKWNIDFNVPLLLEAKIGNNWLDTKDIL